MPLPIAVIVPSVFTGVGVGVGGGGVELVTNDSSATMNLVDVSLSRDPVKLMLAPGWMSAQPPPVYRVELLTVNWYVAMVKPRFGHEVPETSPPTTIGVLSGVRIEREPETVGASTLDGAVVTTERSVPQAASDSVKSAAAPSVNAVRVFFMP